MPEEHAPREGRRRTNRLARERSPYLRGHAHNPVDWMPWGEEAFAAARGRDVPIFLSIGYSTCYWCHVMERESFENESIARLMNEHFVNIKVDREERPDVDEVYMAATQALTHAGGWPMSVFLEPARLRPFYAGTYFPPEPGFNRPGFPQVLEAMSRAWRTRRDEVMQQAQALADAVREQLAGEAARVRVGLAQVSGAASRLLSIFDPAQGGFGGAPKFPQPLFLDFLLDVRAHADDPATLQPVDAALRTTLDAMSIGGIHDHVGGGFHRYATDASWTVPHFEKMLYDNAQLARLYARAARTFDDAWYAEVARTTLEYVLREMTDPAGGFRSAQDAEVNGREGLNYLWTPAQIREALEGPDAEFAIGAFGLDRGTNFRDPHHPGDGPASVLRLENRPERVAERLGMDVDAFRERYARVRAQLYDARRLREQPATDDKIITSWNGLMIAGFAQGYSLLREARFAEGARAAADFLLSTMIREDGSLLRVYLDGAAGQVGFLEDYAHLASGLIALHRAGLDDGTRYLKSAISLVSGAGERFRDPESGGYFDTPADQADLFVRTRSDHDGVMASGSAAMLHNLISLHELTGEERFLDEAARALGGVSALIRRAPAGAIDSVRGLLRLLGLGGERRYPGVLAPPGGEEDVAGDTTPPGARPVEVFADTDALIVGEGSPASMTLALRIGEGYHVVAGDPGPGGEGLVPLRVHVTGGTGVRVYADYPEGEAYGGNAGLGEIRVHTREVEFEVAVEAEGDWTGRPRLALTWQACSDRACLAPVTLSLDVRISRAG